MKRIILHQKERVGAWVAERTGRTCDWGVYEAIGIEEDGQIIGGFVIDNYVHQARASIHAAGDHGKWVTRELLFVLFDYVFRQLGCKVIINPVDVRNEPSMVNTERLGFTEICRIPEGAGGADLAIFVMYRKDCRWLEYRKG